jgi:phosphoribosylformylglycinamidine synthase
MNTYLASINVMPRKELLDPQGKAVALGLHNICFDQIHEVRIGKHIEFEIRAKTEDEATQIAEESCKKLLANQVMESYEITLSAKSQ